MKERGETMKKISDTLAAAPAFPARTDLSNRNHALLGQHSSKGSASAERNDKAQQLPRLRLRTQTSKTV